ncbi:hypothetical protein [Haliscomenobacter sp.]|uniref:hypothetical protein n=1 Tax=Haliscomenobacter sp. TaxID=2717303 RepID=UPI003364FC8E
MKNLRVLGCLALVFLLGSCAKEQLEQKTLKTPAFKVQDGRLVFAAEKDYLELRNLFVADQAQAQELLDETKGFISIRKLFDQIDFEQYSQLPVDQVLNAYPGIVTLERDGKDTYVEENAFGFMYPRVNNRDGIFQIGDTIYKSTRTMLYKFHVRHLGEVANLNTIPGIYSQELKYESSNSRLRNLQEDCESYYDSNKYKLKGRNGRSGSSTNFYMFAESVHYRRGAFSIWFRENATSISVSTSGTSSNPLVQNVDSWNFSTTTNNSDSKVDIIASERTVPSINRQISFSMSSTHSMTQGGGSYSCPITNGWSE